MNSILHMGESNDMCIMSDSVSGTYDSYSWGREFKPHTQCTNDLGKKKSVRTCLGLGIWACAF